MKPKTMKRLLSLPQAQQEKVWQLAKDRLKAEKLKKGESSHRPNKQSQK